MSLEVGIPATRVAQDVWNTEITPGELARLGRPANQAGEVSVVGVGTAREVSGSLYFSLDDAAVLNAGTSTRAIIVRLRSEAPSAVAPRGRPDAAIAGDDQFLTECRRLLPRDVAELASELVGAIREIRSGHLHEGKARKWVNYPSNFVALTIQNRDQSLAIHVRGGPEQHAQTPLDLRADRPGTSRFKISRVSDLAPAVAIIKHASQLKGD